MSDTVIEQVGRQSFADVYQALPAFAAAKGCRPTPFGAVFSKDPEPTEG